MADKTKIEWTDATWNPITGCSPVSPGCANCYAAQLAGTRLKNHPSRAGLTKCVNGRPVWTGDVWFNEEWLRQPLAWKKPRRMMKPQPELRLGGFWHFKDCQWADGGLGFPKSGIEDHAPYQLGDRLWVRETFAEHPEQAIMAYRADGEEFEDADGWLWEPKWTPSIHMPRAASRITLEVTDVRAERLEELTPEDCIAEGILKKESNSEDWRQRAVWEFRELWKNLYGMGAWESNPWVWVICFKVLEVKE